MTPGAILIVDDDSDVRSALSELLQEEGFVVEAARNGREALARLRTGTVHPAVILLDLMMPGMDGWDFRHEQLRDPKLASVPVVIVSASGFSQESIGTQFHPAAYIQKPIEKDLLLGAIRDVVGGGSPPAGGARSGAAPGQLDSAEGTGDAKGDRT